ELYLFELFFGKLIIGIHNKKNSQNQGNYNRKPFFNRFAQNYFNKLVFSSGKIIVGLNVFACSKSIEAYEIMIIISPFWTFRAAGPLRVISPLFRFPFMT